MVTTTDTTTPEPLIDRIVAWLSPAAGLRRSAARAVLAVIQAEEAQEVGRAREHRDPWLRPAPERRAAIYGVDDATNVRIDGMNSVVRRSPRPIAEPRQARGNARGHADLRVLSSV